jgi:hypothetical protein
VNKKSEQKVGASKHVPAQIKATEVQQAAVQSNRVRGAVEAREHSALERFESAWIEQSS